MTTHFDTRIGEPMSLDGGDVLVSPFVSWVHLALAYEPVATPTEGRLRTLRNHRACPAGVKVSLRSSTGVAGSRYWYSSLGLWSAILFRSGERDRAAELTVRANELNSRLALVDWAQVSSVHPDVDLVDLARLTDSISREATAPLRLTSTPGTWAWTRADSAIIAASDGSEIVLSLDSPHLAQSRLGDPLVIVHQEAPNGTRIRLVVPGVQVSEGSPHHAQGESVVLAPEEGGLHGEIVDTPESRAFFERLSVEALRAQ